MTRRTRRALTWLGDAALPIFVGGGLLGLPFYQTAQVRGRFLGTHPATAGATLALVLLALAIAVFSLLRRDHVWANPAELTWRDRPDRDRPLRTRLTVALLLRYAVVGYLFAAGGVLLGWPDLPLTAALAASSALFAFRWANRPRTWVELVAPLGLAAAGVLFAAPVVLWCAVGVLTVVALVPLKRALPARRDELVAGWNARVVRSVSAAFGDVLMLLPRAHPVRMRLIDPPRIALASFLGRRTALPFAVLLALAVPVLHHVFPLVGSTWWTAPGAYLAVMPFAGGLSDMTRVDGLRRWVHTDAKALKYAMFAVLTAAAAVWVTVTWLLGLPVAPYAVPLAAAAAVRTVTRPNLDYGGGGASVDAGGVYTPVGLLGQLFRGPDLLVLGTVVLGLAA
ncbi:hypothetical protein [Actinokineospora inagensis]|uniref:hypothetical protein n=1 Tax=Actinokineospora inagensis TaxID=103730 RepID=UPI00040F0B9B|nr:hypothetical protein [Actinokineospora inagensis]